MRSMMGMTGLLGLLLTVPLLAQEASTVPTTQPADITTLPSTQPTTAEAVPDAPDAPDLPPPPAAATTTTTTTTAPSTLPATTTTAPADAPVAPTTAPAAPPFISWSHPPAEPPPLVQHLEYDSVAMKAKVGYGLYLPPGYADADNVARYPVLFWLHGFGDTEVPGPELPAMVDEAIRTGKVPPMIVVYASGGQRSWYADSVDRQHLAETTIVRELIPLIDANHRTVGTRLGRSVQGIGMGGMGAIKFGLKYPELFASVVAYAGSLREPEDMRDRPVLLRTLEVMFDDRDAQFMLEHPRTLLDNAGADRVRDRVAFKLLIGTNDSPRLLRRLRGFHDRMIELKVEHEYSEVDGVGHHLPDLLKATGLEALLFTAEKFRAPEAAPLESTTQPF